MTDTIKDILDVKFPVVAKSKLTPVDCSNPKQVMGLEIETEDCILRQHYYQEMLPENIWSVDTDGSLRGNSFEFISKPTELNVLIPEVEAFYKVTKFTEANYNDRTSIHVHTNITDMTMLQVASLFLTYSIIEEVLFEFVNHYKVTDPRGKYRDTNLYCVPWSQCRLNHDIVQKMFSESDYTFRNWQKYTALNIRPAREIGTVEWRHMHGSADVAKITQWLNIIGSILKFAKETDFEALVKQVKELNDNSAYQQFYTSVFGQYLPYDPVYEQAIHAGVVNAKYSLMGLKDTKPVVVKKAKATKSIWGDMEMEVRQEAPDPFLPPGVAAAARAQVAGAAAAIPRFDVAAGRRAAEAALQNLQILDDLAPQPAGEIVWPLIRGHIQDAGGFAVWGARDAAGGIYGTAGDRKPAGWTWSAPAARGMAGAYIRGFNADFWRDAPSANWRPAAADQAVARNVIPRAVVGRAPRRAAPQNVPRVVEDHGFDDGEDE